jgi:hypothetical protein
MDTKILEELEAACSQEFNLATNDLGALEQAVRATFIIDWYHACEHLWDCAKVLFGEGCPTTEAWVKKRATWLWDGQTRKLLNDSFLGHKAQLWSRNRRFQAVSYPPGNRLKLSPNQIP